MTDISDFLRRQNSLQRQALKGTETMTTAPTAKAARKSRQEAYVTRLTVSIPISMKDAKSYEAAVTAIEGIAKALPAGSEVAIVSAAFGKMEKA